MSFWLQVLTDQTHLFKRSIHFRSTLPSQQLLLSVRSYWFLVVLVLPSCCGTSLAPCWRMPTHSMSITFVHNDLEDCLESIFTPPRIFCVFIHPSINKKWTPVSLVFSIGNSIFFILFLLPFARFINRVYLNRVKPVIIWILYMTLLTVSFAYNLACMALKRRHLEVFLYEVKNVDHLFCSMRCKINYQHKRIVAYINLGFTLVMFFFFVCAKANPLSVMSATSYYFFLIQFVSAQLVVDTLLGVLILLTKQLNKAVALLREVSYRDFSPRDNEILCILCRIHNSISIASIAISKFFSSYNLFFSGVMYFSVICNTFSVLMEEYTDIARYERLFWSCWYVLKFYYILRSTSAIMKQVRLSNTNKFHLCLCVCSVSQWGIREPRWRERKDLFK